MLGRIMKRDGVRSINVATCLVINCKLAIEREGRLSIHSSISGKSQLNLLTRCQLGFWMSPAQASPEQGTLPVDANEQIPLAVALRRD
jgi:hypothetical protein